MQFKKWATWIFKVSYASVRTYGVHNIKSHEWAVYNAKRSLGLVIFFLFLLPSYVAILVSLLHNINVNFYSYNGLTIASVGAALIVYLSALFKKNLFSNYVDASFLEEKIPEKVLKRWGRIGILYHLISVAAIGLYYYGLFNLVRLFTHG